MSRHAIADLELVVDLLDLDVGPTFRSADGDLRIYRPVSVDVAALFRLRRDELVEWGTCEFYLGSTPIRTPRGPLPVLTAAGRRLALSELG